MDDGALRTSDGIATNTGPAANEKFRARFAEVPMKRASVKVGAVVAAALVVGGGVMLAPRILHPATNAGAAAPPTVSVSQPLQRDLQGKLTFLGQFAPVSQVELRAQVGGTLTSIRFKDGDIVRKGDLLFVIDPVPYQIKVAQAQAELDAANARLNLATTELARARELKSIDAGSVQNVDQKVAERAAAQAAVNGASAMLRDARFDLDRTRVTAPFTGRIGSHLVSTGNLVAGSRAATSPTTLLTTLVSIDPIWINFDMSEAEYATFKKAQAAQSGPLRNTVELAVAGGDAFTRTGTLNFIDNALDRSSGTIRARATVPNADFTLTPGGFARVRLAVASSTRVLLVPDAAVIADQADHSVLTLGKDNVVTPKLVEIGELRGGLRVIRSGLAPSDRVIIDGIPTARPGSPVTPKTGAIRFDPAQD